MAVRRPLVDRVSWGALFAGFFFGFGIWMILLALGAGIGFAAFDPRDLGQWQGLGIGFGIWGVIAGIIAMFLASWLCARVSTCETRMAGMLHGASLWGFMVVAGLWIATMAVTSTAGAVGGAAQAAGQATANPELQREAREQAGSAQQQLEGLRQQAAGSTEEAASTAKKAGTAGSWAFFLYGVLTLAAAMLGGRAGVPKERILVAREEHVPPPGAPLPQRA